MLQHVASFNTLYQAQRWYGLACDLGRNKYELVAAIKRIQQEVSALNKVFILRDWSHVDYLGSPVTARPKNKLALINVLSEHFEIRTIQLIRHLLDTWLSLRRLSLIKKHKIDFSQFLSAYRYYLKNTAPDCRIVYEAFLQEPTLQLEELCSKVGLEFDLTYLDQWFEYSKVTGDTSNGNSLRGVPTIEPRVRRSYDDIDDKWLNNQDDYRHLIAELYNS